MQIVFHSNYINHHQRPFVESLIENGCEVVFVAHEKISEERKALGYTADVTGIQYIQYSEETEKEVLALTMAADAVIFGWKPEKIFRERVKSGKLTFNYSERLFKRGEWQRFVPQNLARLRQKYLFDRENVPYLLAAGDYTAKDFLQLGYPEERVLKWGYFPPMTAGDPEQIQENKRDHTIVWAARFIPWKHPEHVVELGRYLKKQNIPFHIKMIGNGELMDEIRKKIQKYDLSSQIELTGAISPETVRQEFAGAKIALLTSGRKEGWGAVVNESMASGCAMVASPNIGSATYLIQDGVSGMTYKNKKELFRKVQRLLEDQQLCKQIGRNAYHTIGNLWNHRIAAERMVSFVKEQKILWDEGPLSRG